MATAEKEHSAADHHDDHHDHGEFIAHHFDSAEQQFDSGKLGIWLFLVTEILFFSGLFVAYTLYRYHHPEIFDQAHVHLDKYLGGLNTLVLLFSSLTMALGVRAAQLGQNKNVAVYTLVTMFCAAMFLGVKAIEYSHKWDLGIMVRSAFTYPHPSAPNTMFKSFAESTHLSQYLIMLSVIPAILLIGFVIGSIVTALMGKNFWSKFLAGLAITVGGYFFGAVLGHYYQELTGQGHSGGHAANAPVVLYALDDEHAGGDHAHDAGDHSHDAGAGHAAGGMDHGPDMNKKQHRDIGIFFSIYYCMTGLHAIHILAGIGFLAWIFARSLLGHWRSDYFGPVDYVGLYWHLVDLIWIYLFPLLYLID